MADFLILVLQRDDFLFIVAILKYTMDLLIDLLRRHLWYLIVTPLEFRVTKFGINFIMD